MKLFTVTAAACAVVVATSCSSGATNVSGQSNVAAPSNSETPQRPDITQVTTTMFVDRSAVLDSAATDFTPASVSETHGSNNDTGVDPPGCAPLYWGPASTQAGSAIWSTPKSFGGLTGNERKVIFLALAVPTERVDLKALLGKCATVRAQGATTTIAALPLPGVPSWTLTTRIATQGADGVSIIGLYRGLYVSAAFTQVPNGDISPNDTTTIVNLFNDQIAKLDSI